MATSRVTLYEIKKGKYPTHVHTNPSVAVDVRDADACVSLLQRMAKEHKLDPAICELSVKTGIRSQRFRVA